MQNKDVIYIETRSDIPFISFGSRAAKNLVLQYTSLKEDSTVEERIGEVNRVVIMSDHVQEIEELVSRVGFIEIVWKGFPLSATPAHRFFDIPNTKALMEA